MENQRIRAIYEAATRLFLQQGYAKTQISHIAKAVGVSVGTIYHEFMGKEEIMHFILKCTLEPELINKKLERPISDEQFTGLENEIMETFERSAQEFSANLENAGETYGLEDVISDAFDILARYAVGCLFIEKNQMDCPRLANAYRDYRKHFFSYMTEYMNILIRKGKVRPLKSVELSTSLIIEMLAWWAMDMRYISFDNKEISLEQAKEVCMDNIISAYRK